MLSAVKLGKATCLVFFLLSSEGVLAAPHCSHGQFYRVHLSKCVARGSILARDFAHRHQARLAHLPAHHLRPITYVQVIEPEIDIPLPIPSSRLNRQPVVYFDKLPTKGATP